MENTYMYLKGYGEIEEIGRFENGKVHVYLVGGGEAWCRMSEIEYRSYDD